MPRILSQLRTYFTNPEEFIDRSVKPVMSWGELRFTMKPISSIAPMLGSGHFSKTFPLGNKWVVKIDTNNTDPAYEAWADYCMTDGRDNPLCPRIRAKIKLGEKTMYVMERLQEVPVNHPYARDLRYGCTMNRYQEWGIHIPKCPDFVRLMLDFGPYNFGDVRECNMMMRLDGQIVLTDPCSNFGGRGEGAKSWWDHMVKINTPGTARTAEPGFRRGGMVRMNLEPLRFRHHEELRPLRDLAMRNFADVWRELRNPAEPKPIQPIALHERAAQNKAHRGHMHLIHQENKNVCRRQRLR